MLTHALLHRVVVWLINILLAALEKLMALISKNGLIVVAIEGRGFCGSAATAVALLLTHAARIATVATLGNVILFIGKVATAVSCAFFTFAYLDSEAVSSPLLPVIIVFFVSYGVATLFFGVVASIIETVIIAFCLDCDKHGGTAAWAPPLLMEAIGAASAAQKAKEARQAGKGKGETEKGGGDAASKAEEGGDEDEVPVSAPAGEKR
jgi:choline transporter-like protein 2/4/5